MPWRICTHLRASETSALTLVGKNQRTASSPLPLLQGFSDRWVTFSGFRTGSPCAGDPHPDGASFLPSWASWHLGGQGPFPPSHLQVQPGGCFGWTLGFCDDACCPSPGLMGISCLLSNSKAGFPTYKNSFSHPNPGCCKTLYSQFWISKPLLQL